MILYKLIIDLRQDKKMINDKLVRPSEVALILGVSRSTIYRWFWDGKLKGVKFSDKNIRISKNSVDKFIAECW